MEPKLTEVAEHPVAASPVAGETDSATVTVWVVDAVVSLKVAVTAGGFDMSLNTILEGETVTVKSFGAALVSRIDVEIPTVNTRRIKGRIIFNDRLFNVLSSHLSQFEYSNPGY